MDLCKVPGLSPEHRASFDDSDPEAFLRGLVELVGPGFVQEPDALRMPHFYQRSPEELLEWLGAIDARHLGGGVFSSVVRSALNTYQRHGVPTSYVEAIRGKRHPVRGAGQIAGYWSYGITAAYASACDWSFDTDIIKQFQDMGIPAEWTVKLRFMNNEPEWIEVYWQCKMDLDYAVELWLAEYQTDDARCSYADIAACWTAEVPLEYALQTLPWLAGDKVISGWKQVSRPNIFFRRSDLDMSSRGR